MNVHDPGYKSTGNCNNCPFYRGKMNKHKGVKIPGGFGKCIRPQGHCNPQKTR